MINENEADNPGPPDPRPVVQNGQAIDDVMSTNFFLFFRHQLAKIMGRIKTEIFGLEQASYETVLRLELVLESWEDSLPAHMSLVHHEEADSQKPQIRLSHAANSVLEQTQRHLLSTEYNFTRITLHRPYFAGRMGGTGINSALSRKACIDAALDDLWSRRSRPNPGIFGFSNGSYVR